MMASPGASQPDPLGRVLALLPLTRMTRPRCAELPQRIEEIADLARTATDQPGLSDEERLNRACAALNLAALVAADCGLPDLAIDFCERQFQIFHAAWLGRLDLDPPVTA
jgi:hypothetical protein